ncbi:hypothetical protein EBE87_26065 [Pseudoroseomonas wenyumeiae]|uniref:Uncharacterized protein n=1 Tax=Teichococcus wenyumeiae TaxID=2478470 RepID=A0A3A9JG48_9PROT|nr:hypothetical protein D6Z83_18860 [Pseudoroseomonas wenyumeiae]RMI15374.1 hypothetical protein EBE87_26065 [Pseudoroseomonas wenyumeiae]
MPDLIPHHEPRLVKMEGECTTWEYCGAIVRSSGVHHRLTMPGHPLDGRSFGQRDLCFRLVDYWLDGSVAKFAASRKRPR